MNGSVRHFVLNANEKNTRRSFIIGFLISMCLCLCLCVCVCLQLNDDLFIRSEDWLLCALASMHWVSSPEPASIWYSVDKNNLHFTIWWVTVSFKYAGFSFWILLLFLSFFFFLFTDFLDIIYGWLSMNCKLWITFLETTLTVVG